MASPRRTITRDVPALWTSLHIAVRVNRLNRSDGAGPPENLSCKENLCIYYPFAAIIALARGGNTSTGLSGQRHPRATSQVLGQIESGGREGSR